MERAVIKWAYNRISVQVPSAFAEGEKGSRVKIPRELVTVTEEPDENMSLSNREDLVRASILKPGDLPAALYGKLFQCHE